MARQDPWNMAEAVILLDATLQYKAGKITRSEAVSTVSDQLRQIARNKGKEIDDIYRNRNGIDFQMASMESALAGYTIRKPASRLFKMTVLLYNTNPAAYCRALLEAQALYRVSLTSNETAVPAVAKAKPSNKETSDEKTALPLNTNKYINYINKRLYELLKAINAINPNGVTLNSLAKCLKVSEESIEQIIKKADWASYQAGKCVFIDKTAQKVAKQANQQESRAGSDAAIINDGPTAEAKAESKASSARTDKLSGKKITTLCSKPQEPAKKALVSTNGALAGAGTKRSNNKSQGAGSLERQIYTLMGYFRCSLMKVNIDGTI